MLRQNAGKFILGKYLSDKTIAAKEMFGDGSGRNDANSQFLNQNREDAISCRGCRPCRILRGARVESTDGLVAQTHGHNNSAGCKGMAT